MEEYCYDFKPIGDRLFNAYRDLALHMFNDDANGIINPINRNCIMVIDNYDFVTNTYGGFIYPTRVNIYLCSIISASMYLAKYKGHNAKEVNDIIKTGLLFTILHEVSHSDQKIDMFSYKTDAGYINFVENINDTRTVLYMMINREYFESKYKFEYNFTIIDVPGTVLNYLSYTKAQLCESYNQISKTYYFNTIDDMYRCLIMNMFHNNEVYDSLIKYENVVIKFINKFEESDDIIIRQNYAFTNQILFSNELYRWIKKFDYSFYRIYYDGNKSTKELRLTVEILEFYYEMKGEQ